MKKAWKVISKVFVWLVVITTVGVMVFTIFSVNTFNRNDRDLFGYRFYIVLSDSMSATDFDAGDIVVVKRVDPTTLKPGDIIAFSSQDEENKGAIITHKIRELAVDKNGDRGFITYGTTTDTNDKTIVTYPFIQGQYKFAIPKLGMFFQFLRTTQGYIVCILVPFLLLILYQGLNCVKIFRRYKAEQLEELQAEKAAIEEERSKSEAMMAELLAIKEQMAKAAAQQTQSEQPEASAQPQVDVAAMMAELQALKAQLAQANGAPQETPKEPPKEPEPKLEDIVAEFGDSE